MPVDPMYVDPMLGTFRTMMADIDQQGLQGTDVDEMRGILAHMEGLSQQLSDFVEFSARLAQDQSFVKFSDSYGRALAGAAKAASTSEKPSDETMLKNMLDSYEQSLQTYRSGQAGDAGTKLLPIVEKIVELGRSGVSFPVFLRLLEEQSLLRALDSGSVVLRPALAADMTLALTNWNPHEYAEASEKLAVFDEMTASSATGHPDSFALSLRFRRVEWNKAPGQEWWDALIRRWMYMLELAHDWIDSFASFAPGDERWISELGRAETMKNIKRTQECEPGRFLYRNATLHRYFQLRIEEIWTHETFSYEYSARRVIYSDKCLTLLQNTMALMIPGAIPPQELVQQAEEMHANNSTYRPDRMQALPPGSPIENPFL
ncbi:MAG: hypothetical protein JKY56_03250 [Kofleriaceae bacterium]|nr:hypothetical protein [Kofleriaceae bacterium]